MSWCAEVVFRGARAGWRGPGGPGGRLGPAVPVRETLPRCGLPCRRKTAPLPCVLPLPWRQRQCPLPCALPLPWRRKTRPSLVCCHCLGGQDTAFALCVATALAAKDSALALCVATAFLPKTDAFPRASPTCSQRRVPLLMLPPPLCQRLMPLPWWRGSERERDNAFPRVSTARLPKAECLALRCCRRTAAAPPDAFLMAQPVAIDTTQTMDGRCAATTASGCGGKAGLPRCSPTAELTPQGWPRPNCSSLVFLDPTGAYTVPGRRQKDPRSAMSPPHCRSTLSSGSQDARVRRRLGGVFAEANAVINSLAFIVPQRTQRDDQPCLIHLACHLFGCVGHQLAGLHRPASRPAVVGRGRELGRGVDHRLGIAAFPLPFINGLFTAFSSAFSLGLSPHFHCRCVAFYCLIKCIFPWPFTGTFHCPCTANRSDFNRGIHRWMRRGLPGVHKGRAD